MAYSAAGHIFTDGIHGLCCECGRKWVDIQGTEESDVGQPDIAHYGNLTRSEYDSIVVLKKTLGRLCQSATYAVSGGGIISTEDQTEASKEQDHT